MTPVNTIVRERLGAVAEAYCVAMKLILKVTAETFCNESIVTGSVLQLIKNL